MQTAHHTLEDLFEQLGLQGDIHSIDRFLLAHQPLAKDTALYKATFWNVSQSKFLEEALSEDSDWAIVTDNLNSLLRA